MGNMFFENQGTNTFLVYELEETDVVDTLGLGMLTNNSIPGFAPVSFTQMDLTKYIKYNVSAKVSVKQLFSGPVNKKRLIGVFSGVVDAMLSAEDYMLDPGAILLDMDYIFADVTTCETELICLPIMNLQHENQDLAMFFKNILFTTQFDQTENCDHVAQLINYLNSNPVLVLDDFKTLLHNISSGATAQHKEETKSVSQQEVKQVQHVQQVVKTVPDSTSGNRVQQQNIVAKKESLEHQQNSIKKEKEISTVQSGAAVQQTAQVTEEKTMSWLYLMQHYNKENAAIYKAQQDAKKTKNVASVPASQMAAKSASQKQKPAQNAGFAIPGQDQGFAIPGQTTQSSQVANQTVNQTATQTANQTVTQAANQTVTQTVVKSEAALVQEVVQQQTAQTSTKPINFGETTVLGGGGIGETTVLSGAMETAKNDPHLIRTKNNEKIPLNKPVFRIGKERSYVDYFISDNTAISRSHANIIDHNGEFFVVDTNSTNHTYVNGGMIQSGVETKLSHGTKIRLANEDFEFRMY